MMMMMMMMIGMVSLTSKCSDLAARERSLTKRESVCVCLSLSIVVYVIIAPLIDSSVPLHDSIISCSCIIDVSTPIRVNEWCLFFLRSPSQSTYTYLNTKLITMLLPSSLVSEPFGP